MALIVGDRVLETSTTAGTGTLTLAGAGSGYQSFTVGVGVGNQTYYTIYDPTALTWEVGIGTLLTGTTLSRTTVLSNSAGTTALISFAANSKNVFCTYPAAKNVDQSDIGTAPNQVPLNQYLGKLAYEDIVDTISNNPYYDTAISDVQPTLNLDFVNSKTLDSRITFTRSTTATFYDGKSSAVAEQNLLLQSQSFDATEWIKVTATVSANNAVAPDGTTTAETITFTDSSSLLRQGFSFSSGVAYTISVYARSVSGNTTLSFDLTNADTQSFTITGTWARYTWTVTPASAKTWLDIQMGGASVVELWGAQLEQRSSATAYNRTTTTALTNYIPTLQTAPINVARLDYNPLTGTPNGLLIEESRTNLLTYSSDLSNAAWTKVNTVITTDTIIAPDGTLTGDKLVESATNLQHYLNGVPLSMTSGTSYTTTVYAKAAERRYFSLYITSGYPYATFDLNGNGAVLLTSSATASITSVGNGWFRCSMTATASTTGSGYTSAIYLTNSPSAPSPIYTGDGYSGIFIWGAQLEAGAFPTSYIPTTTVAVARSADAASMTGTNFSSWYNISQSSMYVDYRTEYTTAQTSYFFGISDGSGSNRISGFINSSVTAIRTIVTNQNTNYQQDVYGNSLNTKYSVSLQNNSLSAVATGTAVSSTFMVMPTVNQLAIGSAYPSVGYLNGWIRKLQYYPQALSNAELQEMTS